MSGHEILAGLASSPADYARFGLDPTTVARWEDGARTDNRRVTVASSLTGQASGVEEAPVT
jgi:hypothetical protein